MSILDPLYVHRGREGEGEGDTYILIDALFRIAFQRDLLCWLGIGPNLIGSTLVTGLHFHCRCSRALIFISAGSKTVTSGIECDGTRTLIVVKHLWFYLMMQNGIACFEAKAWITVAIRKRDHLSFCHRSLWELYKQHTFFLHCFVIKPSTVSKIERGCTAQFLQHFSVQQYYFWCLWCMNLQEKRTWCWHACSIQVVW